MEIAEIVKRRKEYERLLSEYTSFMQVTERVVSGEASQCSARLQSQVLEQSHNMMSSLELQQQPVLPSECSSRLRKSRPSSVVSSQTLSKQVAPVS